MSTILYLILDTCIVIIGIESHNLYKQWKMMTHADHVTVPTCMHNTNNYAEASIHIMKDILLNRTKAFDVVALMDEWMNEWMNEVNLYSAWRVYMGSTKWQCCTECLYCRCWSSSVHVPKWKSKWILQTPSLADLLQVCTCCNFRLLGWSTVQTAPTVKRQLKIYSGHSAFLWWHGHNQSFKRSVQYV